MGIAERFSLAGKRAVVTGASKGIGAVISAVRRGRRDIAVTARPGGPDDQPPDCAHGHRCLTIEADRYGKAPTRAAAAPVHSTVDILVAAPASRINLALVTPVQTGTKYGGQPAPRSSSPAPWLLK